MERKRHTILSTVLVVLLLAVTQIMGGCRSVKYVEIPTVKTEYISKTDTMMKRDSIFIKDSIVIAKDGDTVMIDRWHTLLKDRVVYRSNTDTLVRIDTLTNTIEVPLAMTRWQEWRLGFANFMLIILGLCLVIFVVQQLAYKYFK